MVNGRAPSWYGDLNICVSLDFYAGDRSRVACRSSNDGSTCGLSCTSSARGLAPACGADGNRGLTGRANDMFTNV